MITNRIENNGKNVFVICHAIDYHLYVVNGDAYFSNGSANSKGLKNTNLKTKFINDSSRQSGELI